MVSMEAGRFPPLKDLKLRRSKRVGGWVGGGQDLKLRRNSTKAGVDGPLEKWWPCLVVGPDTEMVALPGGGA